MRIEDLISKGEGQTIEFKFEINSTRKIAETISAFSNTSGGVIIIGVKDNGKIAGISSDEEIYMIESAAALSSKPEVQISYQKLVINNKMVVAVVIPKNTACIVQAKAEDDSFITYVRLGAGNYKANLPLIFFLENKHKQLKFNSKDQVLLESLNQFGLLTFNQLTKKTKLKRTIVGQSVAKLMRWGIVKFKILHGEVFFIINRELPENTDEIATIYSELLECFDN